MMAEGTDQPAEAGMRAGGPSRHIPVMLHEVVAALQPASGETIIDGTFGAGGYSEMILAKGSSVIAIDRDPSAISAGQKLVRQYGERLRLVQGRFSQLDAIVVENGRQKVHGVVLDIGVSSMQIDEAERGFSFQKDGPLDMRMSREGLSAADLVNRADRKDLTRIIGILGEERQAARISAKIVSARQERPFSRTSELASLIEKTLGRKPGDRIHPATRTFQALRIFINRELEELAQGLFAAERILAAGGRLVVVTFHSLEDRIVKQFFASRTGGELGSRHLPPSERPAPSFRQEKRGAIAASDAETKENPRSRSAKLRWGIRTTEAAMPVDVSLFGLPDLKALEGTFHA